MSHYNIINFNSGSFILKINGENYEKKFLEISSC